MEWGVQKWQESDLFLNATSKAYVQFFFKSSFTVFMENSTLRGSQKAYKVPSSKNCDSALEKLQWDRRCNKKVCRISCSNCCLFLLIRLYHFPMFSRVKLCKSVNFCSSRGWFFDHQFWGVLTFWPDLKSSELEYLSAHLPDPLWNLWMRLKVQKSGSTSEHLKGWICTRSFTSDSCYWGAVAGGVSMHHYIMVPSSQERRDQGFLNALCLEKLPKIEDLLGGRYSKEIYLNLILTEDKRAKVQDQKTRS